MGLYRSPMESCLPKSLIKKLLQLYTQLSAKYTSGSISTGMKFSQIVCKTKNSLYDLCVLQGMHTVPLKGKRNTEINFKDEL